MERYLVKTTPTTSVTYYEDGAVVDPGTVTLTVTREDGTVLGSALPTSGTGAAARTFNLTAATYTTVLDVLKLDWLSASKGTITTYAEIVGGFLFTLAEARKLNPLQNTTTYPTADLIVARVLAETALEEACGVAFVPRYFRDRFDGSGTTDLLLPPRPLTITSVTIGATSASAGTALTASELQDLRLYPDGRLYNPLGWTLGRQNVEVKGTHGYKTLPPRVGRFALRLAKHWLVETPISERATSLTNDAGTVEYLAVAGMREMIFDLPEGNLIVQRYGVDHGMA